LKSVDLRVWPIYHRIEPRVRAHVFLCALAYYVQWHLKRAWEPLLFEEENMPAIRRGRDPVAIAKPSPTAMAKKAARRNSRGLPVHSFATLLRELAKRSRTIYRIVSDASSGTFDQLTEMTPIQAEALRLIDS